MSAQMLGCVCDLRTGVSYVRFWRIRHVPNVSPHRSTEIVTRRSRTPDLKYLEEDVTVLVRSRCAVPRALTRAAFRNAFLRSAVVKIHCRFLSP